MHTTGFGKFDNSSAPRANVTFMVLSGRANLQRRTAVRESWAQDHTNYVFIVGALACKIPKKYRSKYKHEDHHCEPGKKPVPHKVYEEYQRTLAVEQCALEREAEEYSDLILVPMMDTYGGLPRKVKEALSWSLEHTSSDWFMKVDDDVVVRATRIEKELSHYNASESQIIGSLRKNSGVPKGGKWADHEFEEKRYPMFPNGAEGWIVSRHVARLIVDHDGFEYQGEDVSMGIWVAAIEQEYSLWQNKREQDMLVQVMEVIANSCTTEESIQKSEAALLQLRTKLTAATEKEEQYYREKKINPKMFHNKPEFPHHQRTPHPNHEEFAKHLKGLDSSTYTQYHYAVTAEEKEAEQAWHRERQQTMFQHFVDLQSGALAGLPSNPGDREKKQEQKAALRMFLDSPHSHNQTTMIRTPSVDIFGIEGIEGIAELPLQEIVTGLRKSVAALHVPPSDGRVVGVGGGNVTNTAEVDAVEPPNIHQWFALFLNSQNRLPWQVLWGNAKPFVQFAGDRAPCHRRKYLVIGHNLSPGKLRRCTPFEGGPTKSTMLQKQLKKLKNQIRVCRGEKVGSVWDWFDSSKDEEPKPAKKKTTWLDRVRKFKKSKKSKKTRRFSGERINR